MEIVHYFPPSCATAQFLILFLKKKIGAVNAAPISAIKLPVADFRRQLAQGRVQFVPRLTNASAVVLAETAWTMTAI
ncbi:hypothetical protein [Holdemania sp. Marseille-P2844]|uniref:hypothetical protein n=1 Tax=Holdemania sp. Marseille-P2844 TaxID=1852366 RepID=UPI001114B99F|nr:hypothetical protein [Holdemania sp. Marseille-P2844]